MRTTSNRSDIDPGHRGACGGRPHAAALVAACLLPALACGGSTPAEDADALRPLDPPAAAGSSGPNLAVESDGTVYLSWLEPVPGGNAHRLRFAVLSADGGAEGATDQGAGADGAAPATGAAWSWSEARTVAEGDDFFVNWADVPSVVPLPGGVLAAHWLERSGSGTYAYGVRVSVSRDEGATWSEPLIPHADRSETEHGFVSLYAHPAGGLGMAWLDGRDFASAEEDGRPKSPMEAEMSLRSARLALSGRSAGPTEDSRRPAADREDDVVDRSLVDGRVCDCCPTSVAVTDRGPLLVYRNRSEREVRDIHAARLGPDGWSEPAAVHDDGWEIAACPVNGPSVDARGERAVAAWFTAARDTPRVRVAFSSDAGGSFDTALRVDDGRPVGRADVVLAPDGSAVVSWLEVREQGAEILLRRVTPAGRAGPPVTAAAASASRSAGFPRLALAGDRIVLAWTAPAGGGGVRAGWLPLADVPRP